ncbi:MAG TPA: DUF2332 domain-containing protein [Acidimicrobiales bacterium]|nr:DUF2332 domain-containing protein [Acidimicrobiales bacterium]
MLVEQPLADHFRAFATVVERDGGTIYPTISRAVADDDEVLSLLDGATLPQRRPLLLLAAVHFLLLSGVEHPLATLYDTVAAVRGTPFDPSGDPAAAFADFCHEHRGALEGLIATRTTQTNEVGRCTALLPGLCHVAAQYGWNEPLSLLDLGTSAGLNLLFDDYAYAYRAAEGDATLTAGAGDSGVTLECIARNDLEQLPELRLPAMAARVGLDLSPLDPRSDDAALWLLACQWPDNPARFGRLRAALANVRAAAQPPRLERGDMVTDLPQIAATIPGDGPLVVFHSWVAAYLDEAEQRTLADEVRALGGSRPVHYLYCESPFETPGLPTPPPPVPREGPDLSTALVYIAPDGAPAIRLADTHPHGYWIRWWPAR